MSWGLEWVFAWGESGCPVGLRALCSLLEAVVGPGDSLYGPAFVEHLLGPGPCSRHQGPRRGEMHSHPRGG